MNFDQVKSRVDILMHETMAGKDMYSKLGSVVRMLLVLSQSQAAVEIGFSIRTVLASDRHDLTVSNLIIDSVRSWRSDAYLML